MAMIMCAGRPQQCPCVLGDHNYGDNARCTARQYPCLLEFAMVTIMCDGDPSAMFMCLGKPTGIHRNYILTAEG